MEPEKIFFSILIKNTDGNIRKELEVEGSIDSVAKLIHLCERESVPLQRALFDENIELKQKNQAMEDFLDLEISSISGSFSLDLGDIRTFRDLYESKKVRSNNNF